MNVRFDAFDSIWVSNSETVIASTDLNSSSWTVALAWVMKPPDIMASSARPVSTLRFMIPPSGMLFVIYKIRVS